jgi:hypothetical protein
MELYKWYRFKNDKRYVMLTSMRRKSDGAFFIWKFLDGNLIPMHVANFEEYEDREMLLRWPLLSSYDYHNMIAYVLEKN